MCETCSKLTIKTTGRGHWCRSGVSINSEHISQLVLVLLLLTLNKYVIADWDITLYNSLLS